MNLFMGNGKHIFVLNCFNSFRKLFLFCNSLENEESRKNPSWYPELHNPGMDDGSPVKAGISK
jgi:hypothetical protein